MINYDKLFDVAYSITIPESVKDSIYDKILESNGEELNESLIYEDSRCVDLLESLAFSNMSYETINDIIDRTFEGLSEEYINEVSNAFIHRTAKNYLEKRKAERDPQAGPAPVGLKSLQREAKIQRAQDLVNKTKPSAMDKLKGAVGKVKSWFDHSKEPVTLTGINKLKAERDKDIKASAEMGTAPKTEATQTAQAAKPKAKRNSSKLTPEDIERMDKRDVDKDMADQKAKVSDSRKRGWETRRANAQATQSTEKPKRFSSKLTPEDKERMDKRDVDKDMADQKAKRDERYKKAAEKRKATMERKKAEANNKQNVSNASSNVADAINQAEKTPVPSNEALDEFYYLLDGTNISEEAFIDVLGLILND